MSEVCRLCMGRRQVSQQIFGEGGIYYKIKACLPVRILESDSLPKKVCKVCATKVEDIYTYCQKILNVQRRLNTGKAGTLTYASLDEERDTNNTLKFYIKQEPCEDESGHTNNGVIVFSKQEEACNTNTKLTSRSTQTESQSTNDDHADPTQWNDLDKSQLKIKVEDVHLSVNNRVEDFDRNYSSDDDLTLSNILIKTAELKEECFQDELGGKKCLKRKKKDDVSNERCSRTRGRPKTSDEKVKTVSEKDRLAVDGDKYFYPEGTAEELKKWQCLICFVFVESRSDLLLHYKEHLENPAKFLPKTEECGDAVQPSAGDGASEAVDNGSKRRKNELGVHYALINNPDFGDATAYQCLKCLKMFLNKRAVSRHLLCHDDSRPFPCNMCGRAYKRAYEILLHGRVHNGFKTLFCKHPACDYKTVYRGALHNHIKRHEDTGNFKYTCEICHKGFDVLTWYNEHKNVHLGLKPFTCDVCGKGFVYSRYLTTHRKSVHPEAEEKSGKQLLHRCPSCPRQFPHWRRLRAHMKKEHEPQRLPGESSGTTVLCDICGKGLSNKEHLKHHRRTHTGEKPFVCRTCGKGFVKKCNLTLHERVHSGEKPHVCSHCGKAFSQRSTLVIHERYHSGARPYVCSICNKGFVAKGLLSMHQKTCL